MHAVAIQKQIRCLRLLLAVAPFSSSPSCPQDEPDIRQGLRALQKPEVDDQQSLHPLHLHRLALQSLRDQGQLSLNHRDCPRLRQKGSQLPLCVYWSLLKACCKTKALAHAKHLCFCLLQHPLRPIINSPLGEYAILTLVKCGSLEDALEIFHVRPSHSAFAWTALISGYALRGSCRHALKMYQRMREEAVLANEYAFVSLLKAFGNRALLQEGTRLHVEVQIRMFQADLFINAALMEMYAKCGKITSVEKVFDGLPEYNAIVWTLLMSAYVEIGEPEKALQLYKQMQEQGSIADEHVIACALQACGLAAETEKSADIPGIEVSSLETGSSIHVDAECKALTSHIYVGNNLMVMYGKCGSIAEAENVFVELSQRTVVSWTTMLTVYADNKEKEMALKLFCQMQAEQVKANERTFVVMLHVCCILVEESRHAHADPCLEIGMGLHAVARKLGLISNVFVCNGIISMYGRCGTLGSASSVFLQLPEYNSASWNSMLSAFIEHGEPIQALQLYAHLQKRFVPEDQRSIVVVLRACCLLADAEEAYDEGQNLIKKASFQIGSALHDDARKKGFDKDQFVCNSLLSMYGKCGSFSRAQAVFNGLSQPNMVSWNALLSAYTNSGKLMEAEYTFINLPKLNVVSWNTLLSAYVEGGEADLALETYRQNCFKAFIPTHVTFIIALQACCTLVRDKENTMAGKKSWGSSLLKAGQQIHSETELMGMGLDATVGSSLVSMYGSCGSIKDAEKTFSMLSWHEMSSNAMLSAYAELGDGDKVLQLHREMKEEGANFYDATLVSVLQSCKNTGSIELCFDIHFAALSAGYELPSNVLAHAYGHCAAILDALAIFEMLPDPQLESWNALATVYSHHCELSGFLRILDEMKMTDVSPDGLSFLLCLFACAHTGYINLVALYFDSMIRDFNVTPLVQHYGPFLDSLGRAGDFKRAEPFLFIMPLTPDSGLLTCLLSACCKHSQRELAESVFNCVVNLGPDEGASALVLISNLYSEGARACG